MMGGMGYAVEGGMEEQFRAVVVGTVAVVAAKSARHHRQDAGAGGLKPRRATLTDPYAGFLPAGDTGA